MAPGTDVVSLECKCPPNATEVLAANEALPFALALIRLPRMTCNVGGYYSPPAATDALPEAVGPSGSAGSGPM